MNLNTGAGALLYASSNKSLQATIEHAIEDGVVLDGINLKNKDMRNTNFDNAIMRGANFKDSDLTGANMSETVMDGSDFSNAQLYNTCMAYSSLEHCSFIHSNFGGTDLAQSTIDNSLFQGIGTFNILFKNVKSMKNTRFRHNSRDYPMQNIPMHVTGCVDEINVLDRHILIEDEIFTHTEFDKYKTTSNMTRDYILLYNKMIATSSCTII